MSVLSSLHKCSDALMQANGTVHASLASVTNATEDTPRLMRILANDRFYELVSQEEILQAQLEVQREVEPQIKELIQLAEEGLRNTQKRERSLYEMVENRKQQKEAKAKGLQSSKDTKPASKTAMKTTVETAKLKARLMALQTQKENHLKELQRLQAEEEARSAGQPET